MNKTFSHHQRYDRVLRLLNLLQSGMRHNAAELAQKLGVSRRTIYRDIRLLRKIGVRVEHDEANGVYQLARTAEIPRPPGLASDELTLIAVAARLSIMQSIPRMAKTIEAGVSKLLSTLPGADQEQANNLLHSVTAEMRSDASRPRDEVLTEVFLALKTQRQAHIDYAPSAPETSWSGRFSPHHLAAGPTYWLLTGESSHHQDRIIIDVGCIQQAFVTDEPFSAPSGSK